MRTLYGPVDSWRFGRSLGVDPLATKSKQCPYSCTYCQYGETRRPSFRRRVYVTAQRLADDLASLGSVAADCVTVAGLGEPTLASNLPELVDTIRRADLSASAPLPVIVLTGSALIARPDVRRDLMAFDKVVAALDAPDEDLFHRINRPGTGYPYSLAAIVEGLQRFRRDYSGCLALQIMFLQANKHVASQLSSIARSIEPDEVQLSTPLQPALGGPISEEDMRRVARAFAGLSTITVYDRGRAQVKPRMM